MKLEESVAARVAEMAIENNNKNNFGYSNIGNIQERLAQEHRKNYPGVKYEAPREEHIREYLKRIGRYIPQPKGGLRNPDGYQRAPAKAKRCGFRRMRGGIEQVGYVPPEAI